MHGKIGRMFKKREGNDKTPPKALYDDLETAHEVIARKGSATSLKTASRPNLSLSQTTSSPSRSSLQSSLQPYDVARHDTKTRSVQVSPTPHNSSQTHTNHIFSKAQGLETENSPNQASELKSGNDRPSSWQTTVASNTISEGFDSCPQPSRYQTHSNEHHIIDAIPTDCSNPEQSVPTRDIRTPIVVSDTLDNILKTYGRRSADNSQYVIQQREADSHLSINALDSYEERKEYDIVLRHEILPQEVTELGEDHNVENLISTSIPATESRNHIASEADLLNEGNQQLAGMLPSESFGSAVHENLDQYAWSPCPSDSGIDDLCAEPRSQTQSSNAPEHPSDESHTCVTGSTDKENTTSSPESYGNTQKLLEMSDWQPSEGSAMSSDPPQGPPPAIRSSKLAGDLHLAGTGWPLSETRTPFRHFGRVSGVVSDGTLSRPMSEIEVLESLNELVQSNLRAPSISETSSLAAFKSANIEERITTRQPAATFLKREVGDPVIDSGPGSSQTTLSSSREISLGDLSVRKSRNEVNGKPVPRTRAATPPGLFGRAVTPVTTSSSETHPPLIRKNSRLAQAAAAAGIKENGRLGRALAASPDQDWLTETDAKTSREDTRVTHIHSATGSSLANNSDSGDLSSTSQDGHPITDVGKGDSMRHPSHPRYNHSWALLKNQQTGSLAIFPDYVSREGKRLPNAMNVSQARSFTTPGPSPHYQHPKPLPKEHPNPLGSSPIITPSRIELREIAQGHDLTTHQKRMEFEMTDSEYSYVSGEAEKENPRQKSMSTPHSVIRDQENADSVLEALGRLNRMDQAPSSTWLSTVSEAPTEQPSSPLRISSFAKMSVLGPKGNLTGTPEGYGAREVGSSLADNSSPAANFSSSPPIIPSSPPPHRDSSSADYITPISKPENAMQAFHQHIENMDPDYSNLKKLRPVRAHDSFGYMSSTDERINWPWDDSPSMHAHESQIKDQPLGLKGLTSSLFTKSEVSSPGDDNAPMKPLLGPSKSPFENIDGREEVDWLKYLPALGRPKRPPHRRRSSSESESRLDTSPSAKKVSGIQHAQGLGHQKRRSARGFSVRERGGVEDLEIGIAQMNEQKDEEYPLRPLRPQISEGSIRFSHYRISHISTPTPLLDHGAFGPKKARRYALRRPELRTNPYTRPVARMESPHLYSLPCRPDSAVYRHQLRCSRMWALLCVLIPFLGLLFGHGYLDGIMSWHSNGNIRTFRKEEKVPILIYSYTVFVGALVAIALVMVLVST